MTTKKNYNEDIVKDVLKDFENRQMARRGYELKWLLNMNFLQGNQYHVISPRGEVEVMQKNYPWEQREVFNHIATIMETRFAKLTRVRPTMSVRSNTNEENDINTAKLSTKILKGALTRLDMGRVMNDVAKWSEVCGTAFYKVAWNKDGGFKLAEGKENGKKYFEGDCDVCCLPPFEIYPMNPTVGCIDDQQSIIHAKAYAVNEIKDIWNVDVEGESVNVYTMDNALSQKFNSFSSNGAEAQNVKENACVVIEKYIKPCGEFKNGRLTIVAGSKLIYDGDLPYLNEFNGERGYPFVKQTSIQTCGCFWGESIIERLIPIQRSYNAVKNRKYEFLNRISMGMLAVEDGSCDVDNLEQEGLTPGKIIIYRQGATPPRVMENFNVPLDFVREEERLLNEIILVSGVSELLRNMRRGYENTSGFALQLIAEQEDTRLLETVDSIKRSIKSVSRRMLWLYKQYAKQPRLLRIAGETNEVEVIHFSASNITSDDIVFDTEQEISETLAQRRTMVFDLLKSGLLADETGAVSNRMRSKTLDALGFGTWENVRDISDLHISMAGSENEKLINKDIEPLEIDEHDIHLQEHSKQLITLKMKELLDENVEERFLNHIHKHENLKQMAHGKQALLLQIGKEA